MSDPIRSGEQDPFVYQKPTANQIERITAVREACRSACAVIMAVVPSSRERSLAITKLEEVSMWANKAIVFEVPKIITSEKMG